MNLKDWVIGVAKDSRDTMQILAPIFLMLGILGVGAMYALSVFPVFSDWKQNNPKAITAIVIGVVCCIAATGVTGLIGFG